MITLKNKKIIAREVLMFLGASILIGLILGFLLLMNNHSSSMVAQIESQILINKKELDSLKSNTEWAMFSGIIRKQQVVKETVLGMGFLPIVYFFDEKQRVNDDFAYKLSPREIVWGQTPDPILQKLNDPLDKRIRSQIVVLYRLLSFLDYKFTSPKTVSSGAIPPYSTFEEDILKELDYDSKEAKQLEIIYRFLKDEKVVMTDFDEFTFSLGGGSISKILFERKKVLKSKNKNLKNNLNKKRGSLKSSDDVREVLLLSTIIILALLYPIRFFIISAIWAKKTLKE